jgi:tRNA pseudouridine 55 synthase
VNGIIIVDKPQDFTSFDVIAKLRGILGQRKLGHGGTLDPMATGVLPIFAGNATKAADLIPCNDKRYTAVVQLGFITDTGDITGTITKRDDKSASPEDIKKAAESFLGKISQTPPMYSAVKVDGKRLYKLAREGKTIERKSRMIEIFDVSVTDYDPEQARFTLDVYCSKGTYIRTLAEDIAAKTGCLATLLSLRRTMSAGFDETMALPLDEIAARAKAGSVEEIMVPVHQLFRSCPRIDLDPNLTRLFLGGFVFETSRTDRDIEPDITVAVFGGGVFLGLAKSDGLNFKKIKQFYFAQDK